MTGSFPLDWAVTAVSFFNAILLLWLGLTVMLNADQRRTWGVWLSSGGLLVGGGFFFFHSVILDYGLSMMVPGRVMWWGLDFSWIPVAALPFAWYAVMLWYAGFWESGWTPSHRRHQLGLLLVLLLTVLGLGLLFAANPTLSFVRLTQLNLTSGPAIAQVPLLVIVFPLYLLVCIGLSLNALQRPAPPRRIMGDLARQRARPWLIATSLTLLLVSLLVAWGVLWIARNVRDQTIYDLIATRQRPVARYDLVVSGLIGLSILALGQAIVSYEVFTGKTLPRRGLRRYWRNAIMLAMGYGVTVGISPLLATLLMTLFYALLSWRAFAERERYIAQLRPFVASQQLYERLVTEETAPASDAVWLEAAAPFRALCEDLLGTQAAYLVALGPLAPLVNPPLAYPDQQATSLPALSDIIGHFRSPQTICLPLNPASYGGAAWAVPLWSTRGLIGALLLGAKRDGGLYTQEEIEVARASGERLIDTMASAEMARRLMALQRQRLAESQVLDRQARRTLHDDVLPQLHAAMLTLPSAPSEALALLADVHRKISALLREMPVSTLPEVARLGMVGALQRAIETEFAGAFDQVTWSIQPEAEQAAQRLPALTAQVLFYAAREAVRNAARYARRVKTGRPLHLGLAADWQDGLLFVIEDDGAGLPSTGTSQRGSGQGLALHSTMMAVVGGSLAVESEPGAFTRITLTLPASSYQLLDGGP